MTQLNTPYPATAYLTGFLRAARARDLGLDGEPGRRGARAVPAAVLAPLGSSAWPTTLAPRARRDGASRRCRRRSRSFLAHARALRRDRRARRPLPAGPRPEPRAAHRRPRRSCPKGRASRALGRGRRAAGDDPLGVGVRRARHDGPAQLPREPLRRRPRRRDRATASTRASSSRATASGSRRARRPSIRCASALDGEPTLVDDDARRAHARARRAAPPRRRRPDRAVPRQRLRRVPHRARDQARRGAATRSSCSAAATSTPSCASCASRASSTTSTTSRSTTASAPLLALLEHLREPARAARCAPSCARAARSCSRPTRRCTTPARDTGTPTYDGLPLDRYLSLFEMLNPMHRLWSDGRWNKLTVAHGCYWKKCSFCDVIARLHRPLRPPRRPICSSTASRR